MSTAEQPEPHKMPIIKSKKELIVLAVSAVIFAAVIYKMYLSKGSKPMGAAEPDTSNQSPVTSNQPPVTSNQTSDCGSLVTGHWLLDTDDEEAGEITASSTLERDPFVMSAAMQAQVYKAPVKAGDPSAGSTDPVTLTPENMQQTLDAIPGAEEAAKKGLVLSGVMINGDLKACVINGKVVLLNKTLCGFRLVEVAHEGVLLQLDKHRVRLVLPAAQPPQDTE